ncbi:FemAB family XrtA/PEP-CTERM system-associated protein [Methanococcoides methylutens]|uniref:FemAB family XrtA/PEP-CTERM system-associated protein n=1 Tax=Methanococcoides methylutens TaxID=2226 RepID=UPI00404441ED
MDFQIKQLKPKDEKRWDEFVMKNDSTTFYHQIGWKKVIEETYKHEPYYLLAEDDVGNVVGILPMFYMANLFFGKRLISVPFAPYGGICADDDSVRSALIDQAIDFGNEQGVNYSEFRNSNINNGHEKLISTHDYFTFTLDLSKGLNHIWDNMSKSTRRAIRKGEKNNLKYEIDSNFDLISDFYEIYSVRMKLLGTPVHSKKFFKNIHKTFTNNILISKASLDGLPVSTLYSLKFKDSLITGWGASLSDFLKYAPNQFVYWNCIKYASEKNLLYFDFGRSLQDSGAAAFKSHWGSAKRQLNYCYYPSTKIPLVPHNEYENFAQIWSKIPLSLTNKIGPMVRRGVP